MNKKLIIVFLSVFLTVGLWSWSAHAHEGEESVFVISEEVSAADLGVEDPGILPTNPFYFLKEFRRGITRFFTFNGVAKVELELEISNQKAAEAKKVFEVRPDDAQAVTDAIENYSASEERLRSRLESLEDNSRNPNVDKLLEKLADRAVKHEKVFSGLGSRFEGEQLVADAVKAAKKEITDATAAGAAKDDPAQFASKLGKALVDVKGGELKHVYSVEIIDRLQEKASESIKPALGRLREEFKDKLSEDIKGALKNRDSAEVSEALKALPGDAERRSIFLEEIKIGAEAPVVAALESAGKKFVEEAIDVDKAQSQIQRADELIAKLRQATATETAAPFSVRQQLAEVEFKLKQARLAFEEKKYGEAFGQARSAEVLTRNALRVLEEERPKAENIKKVLAELEAKVSTYERLLEERGFTAENNPKAFALLAEAKKHLGFATDALSKEELNSVVLHVGHVRGYLKDLSRLLEERVSYDASVKEAQSASSAARPVEVVKPSASENIKPVPIISRCEAVKVNIGELERLLSGGQITKEDYARKYAIYFQELALCQEGGLKSATSIPFESKPLEVRPLEKVPEPVSVKESRAYEFKIEGDDLGFYPSSSITVPKGSKVKLHFIVRTEGVYYAGLRFNSPKFNTGAVKPGDIATVEFVADDSFEFHSWWPAADVLKATGKIIIQ